MAHLSNKKLSVTVSRILDKQMVNAITSANTYRSADNLLEEILGPEERIMLAKRLAVIIMLLQDMSSYRIAQTLVLSDSTVRRIKIQMGAGSYEYLIRFIKKQKDIESFWNTLGKMSSFGLPPYKHGYWDRFAIIKKRLKK